MNKRIAKKVAKAAGTRPLPFRLLRAAGRYLSRTASEYDCWGRTVRVLARPYDRTSAMNGEIIIDVPYGATIILREDGCVQRNGQYMLD